MTLATSESGKGPVTTSPVAPVRGGSTARRTSPSSPPPRCDSMYAGSADDVACCHLASNCGSDFCAADFCAVGVALLLQPTTSTTHATRTRFMQTPDGNSTTRTSALERRGVLRVMHTSQHED